MTDNTITFEFTLETPAGFRANETADYIAAARDTELHRILTTAENVGATWAPVDHDPIKGGARRTVIAVEFDEDQRAKFNALPLSDRGYYDTFADYIDALERCDRSNVAARKWQGWLR